MNPARGSVPLRITPRRRGLALRAGEEAGGTSWVLPGFEDKKKVAGRSDEDEDEDKDGRRWPVSVSGLKSACQWLTAGWSADSREWGLGRVGQTDAAERAFGTRPHGLVPDPSS